MPAALTLILICPSPGSRSGTPAHLSTSGGPYPVITTALGIVVPSFLVAASGWPRMATSACSWCALSCSIDSALRRCRRFPAPLAGQQGQRTQGGDLRGLGVDHQQRRVLRRQQVVADRVANHGCTHDP